MSAVTGLVVVAALFVFFTRGDDDAVTLDLDEVPEGVSPRVVGGEPVFVVRAGDELRVLLADTRHLPEDTLWWCPTERVFVGVEHGEQFDAEGRKIGGPSQGGLNELAFEVDGSQLVIDTGKVIEGANAALGEAPLSLADADFSEPFDSGPGSFCVGAVVSPSD